MPRPAEPIRISRVAAYALCTDADAILLSRISPGATGEHDGYWTLPGGGIEFGEPPDHAAIRELAEETGLIGTVTGLAAVDSWAGSFVDPDDGVEKHYHGIRILYRVRISGGELRDEVGGSTDPLVGCRAPSSTLCRSSTSCSSGPGSPSTSASGRGAGDGARLRGGATIGRGRGTPQ